MNVGYVTQKNVPIADCLSRLVDVNTQEEDPTLNLQIADLGIDHGNVDWNSIRQHTIRDPSLVTLAHYIQQGWPESSRGLPDDVKVYFPYRLALCIIDGIIILHNRIVVPKSLREHFLDKVHAAHLGVVKSKLLARTLMYCPNYNDDVERRCAECEMCRSNQQMPANVPKFTVEASTPGEMYGCDIADIAGNPYLVVVDYKSVCIFERKLPT